MLKQYNIYVALDTVAFIANQLLNTVNDLLMFHLHFFPHPSYMAFIILLLLFDVMTELFAELCHWIYLTCWGS